MNAARPAAPVARAPRRAAPLGSATIFACRTRNLTASRISSSLTVHHLVHQRADVREREIAGPHCQQAVGNRVDAIERRGARQKRLLIFGAPAGSTPTTRTSGINA